MSKSAQGALTIASDTQHSAGNAPASAENRWEARRKSRFPAIIVNNGTGVGIRCTLSDMSSAGAMLLLGKTGSMSQQAAANLSETFTLHMPFDRTEVKCKVAWRSDNRIGVRFVSPMQSLPPAPRKSLAKQPEKPGSKFGWPFKKAN